MRNKARACRRRLFGARVFLTLTIALTALVAGAAGVNAATRPAWSPFLSGHPSITLPAPAKGSAALNALGAHLPDVAKAYGWTAAKLTDRFKNDSDLNVDKNGYLLYTDAAPTAGELAAAQAAAQAAAPGAAPQALAPLADTFKLHSLPGAAHIIYLDFDGYTLHADAWTAAYNGGNDIVAPPFDTDGNPGSFSNAELTTIQQVWQRTAEDYAPFNVDVTTEYLGEDRITRSDDLDNLYGMRVLISPLSSYVGNYGGMAYVGVFDAVGDYYKPALVLPDKLANGNEKNVGEAAAHENGHTLGLSHMGTFSGGDYYAGQGSGDTGWAPIMGVGYYRNLTQWSKGEYANANNTEDELAIMGTFGAPFRADDVGDSTAAATNLPGSTSVTASGIIGPSTDADVFRVSWGAGPLTVSAVPAALGPDLDIRLDVLDSNGNAIASDNPTNLLTAGVALTVAQGTYYIRVRGTGRGNPLIDGYSSYASLGAYTISATNVSPPPAAPTGLTATATSSTAIRLDWTDNAGNETGYYIERWNGATSSWDQIATVGANAVTYTDNSLSPSTSYTYNVGAYNSGGTIWSGGSVSATTQSASVSPPAAPTGLTASAASTTSILVGWADNATNETGYRVYRWNAGTSIWDLAGTTAANAISFTDAGRTPATTYTYQVASYNGGGETKSSGSVSATTLPALTRYDQTNIYILKTGTWADYSAPAAYLGSYGRASTSGAGATIYFTGTRLDWIAMKGLTTGIADVYLDGTKVATINLAAFVASYQQNVWTTGTLANGPHNVRIVRSTTSALGKFITLDALDIWGTLNVPPVTLTRYDQKNTAIVKTGIWANYTATAAYLGSYGRSSTGGTSPATATIKFIGTRLDWIAMKGLTTGIVDVYLDTVKVATIDLTAGSATYQVNVWSTGTLAYNLHTVKLVRSNTSAVGKFLTLDAVDIWGAISS